MIMEVSYNEEVWKVFTHEGTEKFYMAQRTKSHRIDMDSDGRIWRLDRPELIPKKECKIIRND